MKLSAQEGNELSSLPQSWEQDPNSLYNQHELTLSMASSARVNKYVLGQSVESKNQTLSRFRLQSSDNHIMKQSVSSSVNHQRHGGFSTKAASVNRARGESTQPGPSISVANTNLNSAGGTQYGSPSSSSILPLLLMNPLSVEADIVRRQKKRENEQMRQRIKELELKIRYKKRELDKVNKVREQIAGEVRKQEELMHSLSLKQAENFEPAEIVPQ